MRQKRRGIAVKGGAPMRLFDRTLASMVLILAVVIVLGLAA
jgi:hypothetical protein